MISSFLCFPLHPGIFQSMEIDFALAAASSRAGELPTANAFTNANHTCQHSLCSEGSACMEGDLGVYCECYYPQRTNGSSKQVFCYTFFAVAYCWSAVSNKLTVSAVAPTSECRWTPGSPPPEVWLVDESVGDLPAERGRKHDDLSISNQSLPWLLGSSSSSVVHPT